jgi:hypothetical protein
MDGSGQLHGASSRSKRPPRAASASMVGVRAAAGP